MSKYKVTYQTGELFNYHYPVMKSVTVEAESYGLGQYTEINDNGTFTAFFYDSEQKATAIYTNVHVLKRLS